MTKEQLREDFYKVDWVHWNTKHSEFIRLPSLLKKQISDYWLDKLDTYADAKIDKMFEEERNRNKGMIKVRGKNGVTLVPKEDLKVK